MKKIALSFFGLIFMSDAFAVSTSLSGFIALEPLTYMKEEDHNAKYTSGVGVLDAKIYAKHKDFSSKIKFDLDTSSIKYHQLNFVEEFLVSWAPNWDYKLTMGRGKVKFHRLHWGATEHCYTDGGAILNPQHKYRDLDKRPVAIFKYGNKRDHKFENHISLFSNPDFPQRKSNGSYNKYAMNYKIDLTEERGIADMFEWYPTKTLNFSASALYYKHDLNPHANYAFDFGGQFRGDFAEVWFEYIWGRHGMHPDASRAVFNSHEQTFQLGGKYEYSKLIDLLLNFGGTIVKWTGYSSGVKDNYEQAQNNFKGDFAVGFNLNKATQLTVGTLVEKQYYVKDGGNTHTTWGHQMSTGLSMGF